MNFGEKTVFPPKERFGTACAHKNPNPSPTECMDLQEILCTNSRHTSIHGVSALFLSDKYLLSSYLPKSVTTFPNKNRCSSFCNHRTKDLA